MVLLERIELSTSPLPRECSASELQQHRKVCAFYRNIGQVQALTERELFAGGSFLWPIRPIGRYAGVKPPFAANCDLDHAKPMLYRASMSDRTEKPDAPLSGKALAAARREERLRKQLRANLKRRKAQTKARKPGGEKQ